MTTVGVDLGGTKCLGVVVDDVGAVVDELRVPTPGGSDAIVDVLADVAGQLMARQAEVGGVGVGVPGLVDGTGALRFAPNLPGVVDLPLAGPLAERVGVPVVVENDAVVRRLGRAGGGRRPGSRSRAPRDARDRDRWRDHPRRSAVPGHNGFAGEIGHMVIDPHGPPCVCGQRGCWERFASGSGLGRLAREAAVGGRADRIVALAGGDPEDVKGEHVTAAAGEGDDEALTVMADFGWWVALGLANLANAFDPELFVLGGGLVEAGEVLLAPVRRSFAELLDGADHRPDIGIVAAELGEHAGAIGAGLLARRAR